MRGLGPCQGCASAGFLSPKPLPWSGSQPGLGTTNSLPILLPGASEEQLQGSGYTHDLGLLRSQARDILRRQGRLAKEPPGITGVCCCTRLFMWVLGSKLTKQWLYGLSHIAALPRFCYFHGIMVVPLSSKHPGGRSRRLATSSRVHTCSAPLGLHSKTDSKQSETAVLRMHTEDRSTIYGRVSWWPQASAKRDRMATE